MPQFGIPMAGSPTDPFSNRPPVKLSQHKKEGIEIVSGTSQGHLDSSKERKVPLESEAKPEKGFFSDLLGLHGGKSKKRKSKRKSKRKKPKRKKTKRNRR
jgi:hypothetical protein